MAGTCQNKIDY